MDGSLTNLKAPFVWYGGKSKVAADVWRRFGKCDRYIEPFFGSGAMLLANPYWQDTFEVVNDLDHNVANCWRALKYAPDDVAYYADQPTNEIELHLNHLWIVNEGRKRLKQCPVDESYFDAETAGRWLWGMACWIGSGYARGDGPWTHETLALAEELGTYDIREINRQLPHLRTDGQGVNRQLPHLGTDGQGVNRQLPHLGDDGRGVRRARPSLDDGKGVKRSSAGLYAYLRQLSERFANVNVCCGSWDRVLGPSVTQVGKKVSSQNATCAVFLDPPYSALDRAAVYSTESYTVAHDVREWCKEWGVNQGLRIALCGYDTEHYELESLGWSVQEWTPGGGYAAQGHGNSQGKVNRKRERIWYSPGCRQDQGGLFT